MSSHIPIIRSLEELHASLRARIPSPVIFGHLNTRLIIQLGVNLNDILPEQNRDPALLQKVLDALKRMNIRVEATT
ncbi:MAG: hypothetical protein IPM54_12620 [Polyangiaceae bacterium]|nr:hypothetical protein [Polyangiaceae bacterium]